MDGQMIIFVMLAAVALASSVMVVTRRNPVHSALYLIVTFFAVAAVFVLLRAELLGAVQLLVYAGGIMVLFLFVIMLVERPASPPRGESRPVHVAASILMTALVAAVLSFHFLHGGPARAAGRAALAAQGGNLETVAEAMFRYYLFPFEAVSVLLLVALVGAVVLARSKA
ncbi:MAG: NADH-quinone oxidoreductase subunit J [Acidobacteriia bacterium]|nr:NADH-quinone oxidoreductase subunit J [Terriglobia bacterium]